MLPVDVLTLQLGFLRKGTLLRKMGQKCSPRDYFAFSAPKIKMSMSLRLLAFYSSCLII